MGAVPAGRALAPCERRPPPSPPSGPPWGMKGSRLKEAEPRPPWPARRTTRAESTNCRRLLLVRGDADAPAVLAHPLVANLAGDEGEKRVVAAQADARARGDLGPTLADEDRAGVHGLAGVDLHAQHLRLGVATVAGGTPAFLVCHLFIFVVRL